ncbi:MAG: PadR family transcriptional regulator [Acidobacteriia bacterium]|nr:PadR family transcriptional regulator [Terriglobia bacterium]
MRNRTFLSSELLPGTLEMLILKTLTRGPAHGYAIARHLERISGDVLRVGESSLYPALQRLLVNDWVRADWGESELKRRARIYRITPAGRKRLAEEAEGFARLTGAVALVMEES